MVRTAVMGLGAAVVLAVVPILTTAQEPMTVEMRDFSFQPHEVAVLLGASVRWINRDDSPHSVVMQGGKPGNSPGFIDPGKDYTFVFREAGRFVYRCGVHPTMLGEIVVQGQ